MDHLIAVRFYDFQVGNHNFKHFPVVEAMNFPESSVVGNYEFHDFSEVKTMNFIEYSEVKTIHFASKIAHVMKP